MRRRAVKLPNALPPATLFDPRLPGFAMPAQSTLNITPVTLVLPEADEDIAFAPVRHLSAWIANGQLSSVRLTREVLHRNPSTGLWSSTAEVAYYAANSVISAHNAATAIRNHWHIENKLHYTRDVTFQEDQSRIRHSPGIFARLRSFAYNILRRNRTSTFAQDRYAAALARLDALFKWSFS